MPALPSSSPPPAAVVVGGGVGGLVAALELALAGVRVTLCERGATPGGKLRRSTVAGRSLDVGPTVLTMPWVFRRIFADADTELDQHVKLRPASLLARHFWQDGACLDLHCDEEGSAAAVAAAFGAGEAEGFRRFVHDARNLYAACLDPFLLAERPRLMPLVRSFAAMARRGQRVPMPWGSVWGSLGGYFREPRLRQLFGRYATYYGSSPFAAPRTLNLIAAVELAGVWLVEGGMYALVEALAGLARSAGVELLCDAEVAEVQVEGGRARGVRLRDGRGLAAHAVVANCDLGALGRGLLGEDARSAGRAVSRLPRSLSALTLAMVARARGPELAHHNVFFSRDYRQEFGDILEHRRLPGEPTVYVCAQDRELATDPDAGERLFFIINAPPDGDRGHLSPEEKQSCVQRALALLHRCGLTLETEAVETTAPADFERSFPGTGGALYGPATHGWRAALARPPARTRIAGLYATGGSVHPGAGVPMVALSGRLAATSVLADFRSTSRYPLRDMPGGTWTGSLPTAAPG
jgi:1-hydroxycarotenoid 3,4-desaturase